MNLTLLWLVPEAYALVLRSYEPPQVTGNGSLGWNGCGTGRRKGLCKQHGAETWQQAGKASSFSLPLPHAKMHFIQDLAFFLFNNNAFIIIIFGCATRHVRY